MSAHFLVKSAMIGSAHRPTPDTAPKATVRLFCSHSCADEVFWQRLEKHLTLLQRQKLLEECHGRSVEAGQEWAPALLARLEQADIILLLLSADFLASDYFWGVEMERALARHREGSACVIPIIVRPVELTDAPFTHLQCLPSNSKAVVSWAIEDEAWANVTHEVRRAAERIRHGGVRTLHNVDHTGPKRVSQSPPLTISSADVDTASLRRLIDALLLGDDLDAFCQSYFPDVERRFTSGMQQVQKATLLLRHGDRKKIFEYLAAVGER